MANSEKVLVGDRVRWTSDTGQVRRGEVLGIYPVIDSFGCESNYIYVEYFAGRQMISDQALERIGFKVCFRDIDVQLAQAAKDLMSLSIRAA